MLWTLWWLYSLWNAVSLLRLLIGGALFLLVLVLALVVELFRDGPGEFAAGFKRGWDAEKARRARA